MSGFELIVGVIGAFFIVGFAIGVLLVIALPAFRRRPVEDRRPEEQAPPLGWPHGWGDDAKPSGPRDEDGGDS
jgi:hypothetical protein